ncbi:MAG TPA: transposase [Candidatus Didemnitutus sp.]|jgi:REP element-mobilizing transposase RayT
MPRHLLRLADVWDRLPVFFITVCVDKRRPVLATESNFAVLFDEWRSLRAHLGWNIGRYVVMPDHVHFFAMPDAGASTSISVVIGRWKERTSRRINAQNRTRGRFWQPQFFDHVLRSNESRSEKWLYIAQNPVRAGYVSRSEDWPYAGWIDFE